MFYPSIMLKYVFLLHGLNTIMSLLLKNSKHDLCSSFCNIVSGFIKNSTTIRLVLYKKTSISVVVFNHFI